MIKFKKGLLMTLLLSLIIISMASMGMAGSTGIPNGIYGSAYINGTQAPAGTLIEAYIDYPENNTPRETTIVGSSGGYTLSVPGSSNDDGKTITFIIKNVNAGEAAFEFVESGPSSLPPDPTYLDLNVDDIKAPLIEGPTLSKSIVKNGDTVTVSANVTDEGSQVETVSLDASAINSSASDVVMQEDDGSTYDWNNNNAADAGLYGATVVVDTENNGEQTLSIEAVDYVGNHNSSEVVCNVDNTPPIAVLDDPLDNSLLKNNEITFNFNLTDNLDDSVDWTLYIDGVENASGTGLDEISETVSGFSEGVHNWSVSVEDTAGNTNNSITRYFTVDTEGPTITLDSIDEEDYFTSSTIWINGTYNDSISGVDNSTLVISVNNTDTSFDSMLKDTDSFNYSLYLPDGEHNVTIDVADNVGNDATQVLKNFTVDTESPTITLDSIDEGDYFTSNTIWINGTFSDGTSGINTDTLEILVNGTSVDSINIVDSSSYNHSINLEDAEHNVTVSVKNNVGHSSTTGSVNFSVDTMPPTTDNNAPEEPAENPFTITFQPLDEGGSGVNATFYRINGGEWIIGDSIHIYEAGEYTIKFYSDDIAGNTESINTVTVNLTESDTVAPVTTDDAPQGWQTESFTVNLIATDEGGSGVDKTLYRMDDAWLSGDTIVINTPGNHTIEYYSIDKAGNEEPANVTYAKYDPDDPAMNEQNITPQSILNTSTDIATVTVNVTDQVSGLDNVTIDLTRIGENVSEMVDAGNNIYSYSISTTHPAGDFSFNVTATDKAGNSVNESLDLNVTTSDEAISTYSEEDGQTGLSSNDIDQAIQDNEAGEVSDETVLVLIEEYFN